MIPTTEMAGMPVDLGEPEAKTSSNDNNSASARLDRLGEKVLAQPERGKAEAKTSQEPAETKANAEVEKKSDDGDDKTMAQVLRALLDEDEAEAEAVEPEADKAKAKAKTDKTDDSKAKLNRRERYYYDKASGDPVRMVKTLAQQETYIADLRAEVAEAMEFARNVQPKFDLKAAYVRASEELSEDHPEWAPDKIQRHAKALALADQDEFNSKSGPETEKFENFISKQRKREADKAAEFESAKSGAEKIFLDNTDKNVGLTRYAVELAVKKSRETDDDLDPVSILDEAKEQFEADIVEHIKRSAGFGPDLMALVASIAEKNEPLVKRLAVQYLRKTIKPTGGKKAASPATVDDTSAAYATGAKRGARTGGDVAKGFDKVQKAAFAKLGL